MKKHPIDALIPMILVLVGFIAGTGVIIMSLEANQNQVIRMPAPALAISCQGVTISNGNYNISVSVNATQSESIKKISINSSVLNTYLNGTAVNIAKSLNYHLRNGDYLQVNFIMPCTEACQNQTIGIAVFASQAMCYIEANV